MLQLVGKKVGAIGFGMMGLSWGPPIPQQQAFDAMRAALKLGNNFWNGGSFYGPREKNSLVLLEQYLEKYPEDTDEIVISIKGGLNPALGRVDASPEYLRQDVDESIAQLKGRKKIDMFEIGRQDPNVPMETSFGFLDKEYVQTGKIGGISLSEATAEVIHEAVKYTKIVAVEVELSMFATDTLENGVAAACAQHGITLIAYSPIGRGMLTGRFKKPEDLPKDSLLVQRNFPRFQGENFEHNRKLAMKVEEMAEKKGCTPAQLAINWTRALSRRPGMPTIIPIPGSSTVARVEENSKLVDITDEEMAQIDAILADFTPAGTRYPS